MAFIDCIDDHGDPEGVRLGALHTQISLITKSENKEEAQRFLQDYTIYLLGHNPGWNKERAITVACDNVGYLSGYSDPDTMLEIQRVFGVKHPAFKS